MRNTSVSQQHGGEVYALAHQMRIAPESLLDFSSNANIFAKDITEHLVQGTPYPFLHYPDTQATALVEDIARYEQVTADRVLPGNGAAELIWLALRALTPRKILFIGPVFSEYVTACHALGIGYDILTPSPESDFTCTSDDMAKVWESDADLAILCTPNNPAAVTYNNIHALLHMLRTPRVFIDNSYREFLYGTEDYEANHLHAYTQSIRQGVSLYTLHSMTKFFCCPGIRLGYLLGDRTTLARMAALRSSWTISPYAQVMGRAFLASIEAYRERLPQLYAAITHMGREMRRFSCVHPDKVFEGAGFLCCGLHANYDVATVVRRLLHYRIIVRNCDTIPGMPKGFLRVQARPDEDSAHLFAALETVTH